MAELADAIDLGSIVHRRAGSSPVIRTMPFASSKEDAKGIVLEENRTNEDTFSCKRCPFFMA